MTRSEAMKKIAELVKIYESRSDPAFKKAIKHKIIQCIEDYRASKKNKTLTENQDYLPEK
jgi:hypothetical protein